MISLYFTIFLTSLTIHHGESANILAIFPTQMKSHFIVGQQLLKELAISGHEVTVICPFKVKNPPKSYHEIITTIPNESFEGLSKFFDVSMIDKITYVILITYIDYAATVSNEANLGLGVFFKFLKWGMDVNNATLTNPEVQKLLKSNTKFDVMLYELFINDALLGFANHFNIPVIGISTVGFSPFVALYTGSPIPNSFIPNIMLGLPEEMNFKQRLINTMGNLYVDIMFRRVFAPANDKFYNEHFSNPKPPLDHLRKTALTMVLANSHISLNG